MIQVKLAIVPPTATAQQKGVFVRNGRAHFFTKQKVRDAEDFLAAALAAGLKIYLAPTVFIPLVRRDAP